MSRTEETGGYDIEQTDEQIEGAALVQSPEGFVEVNPWRSPLLYGAYKIWPEGYMDNSLPRLAELLRARNSIDVEISQIIERPASIGHMGEFIAARVFGMTLHRSASTKGNDGIFNAGPLAGKTVNVKWYTTSDNLMDLKQGGTDYYLVLSGGKTISGRVTIDSVYLFNSAELVDNLRERHVKIGNASSVRSEVWDSAEIYPRTNSRLRLSDQQIELLGLFHY